MHSSQPQKLPSFCFQGMCYARVESWFLCERGKTSEVGIYHQGLRGSCSKGTPLFVARGPEISLQKEFGKVWALERLQRVIYLSETSCYWFTASFNCLGDVSQMFLSSPFSHPVFSPCGKCIRTQRHFERARKQWNICVKRDRSVGKVCCALQKQTRPWGRSQGAQALKHFSVFVS